MPEGVYMTTKEIERLEILSRVKDKRLNQRQAAKQLNISLRQVQRLYKLYQAKGAMGIASKKRGRTNNKIAEKIKMEIEEVTSQSRYSGFGPTLMSEKLWELHGIKISRETTRQIMIKRGLWIAKRGKRPVIHQQRQSRARAGELLQIDGSPHAWFEDRGQPCTLLVFIDDATGQTFGKFCESESTKEYMTAMYEYIKKYGRPVALYSDKHGIFRVNQPSCNKNECITQFGRAMQELEIKLIYANSPQAKGRVERANATLQDRLIKEMRLAGIRSIEEGNKFLESYLKIHNEKFSIVPEDKIDAHRAAVSEEELERILSIREYRKVSKNLEVQYNNTIYQIEWKIHSKNICGSKIAIYEGRDGKLKMEYKGRALRFKKYGEQKCHGEEVDSKQIDRFLNGGKERVVPESHPWKQQARGWYQKKKQLRCKIIF